MSPASVNAARLLVPNLEAMPSFVGAAQARRPGRRRALRKPPAMRGGRPPAAPAAIRQFSCSKRGVQGPALSPSYPPAGLGLAFCEPPS